jgi:hypothetical protein
MMFRAIEVITKLFTDKVVKHDGGTSRESARLTILSSRCHPGGHRGAAERETHRQVRGRDHHCRCGRREIAMLWGKFREGATEAVDSEAMTTQLRVHVSWAPTQREAGDQALRVAEWRHALSETGHQNPEDFENMARWSGSRTSPIGC